MKAVTVFLAALLFSVVADAQIPDLCNTGQTPKTATGCTGVLVTPNALGGGPNRDGNWQVDYPYPSPTTDVCAGSAYTGAWVDTPNYEWLSNSSSPFSEWITVHDGEATQLVGFYVYRTVFHIPSELAGGGVPTGVVINGRLASDNATFGFFMRNLGNGSCALVPGFRPLNYNEQFFQWKDFSFQNPIALTPGSDLLLYVLVANPSNDGSSNPTGFRIEFSSTSAFF